MFALLVLTDAAASSGPAAAPGWLSGVWGLLGTVVGGAITYFTTRSANLRSETAQRKRDENERINAIAVRFIDSVADYTAKSMNVEGATNELGEIIKAAMQSDDPVKQAEALQSLSDAANFDLTKLAAVNSDLDSALEFASKIVQGAAGVGPSLPGTNAILAEMRLNLPISVVRTAETVAAVAVGLSMLSEALPPAARLQLGQYFTGSLTVFVNAVRAETGLAVYKPEELTFEKAIHRVDQLAAEQQKA